jgi:hypothetical protein
MSRSIDRGRAVADRVLARMRHEMEWNGSHPLEVFVSSADWHDLDLYLQTKAKYEATGTVGPTVGIKMAVDGSNHQVEVKDLGRIVVA